MIDVAFDKIRTRLIERFCQGLLSTDELNEHLALCDYLEARCNAQGILELRDLPEFKITFVKRRAVEAGQTTPGPD